MLPRARITGLQGPEEHGGSHLRELAAPALWRNHDRLCLGFWLRCEDSSTFRPDLHGAICARCFRHCKAPCSTLAAARSPFDRWSIPTRLTRASIPTRPRRISVMRCRTRLTFPATSGPLPTASANVVLCTETLEHVLETRRFLAEAARCLAPGGTLLLTVPFAATVALYPLRLLALYALQPQSSADGSRLSQRPRLRTRKRLYGRVLQAHDPSPAAPDASNRIKDFAVCCFAWPAWCFYPCSFCWPWSRIYPCMAAEAMIASAIQY